MPGKLSINARQVVSLLSSDIAGGSMSKKWYNYFVSVDEQKSALEDPQASPEAPPSAAQTVADIAASVGPEPKLTNIPPPSASFDEIYNAAEIHPPQHGYTIYK